PRRPQRAAVVARRAGGALRPFRSRAGRALGSRAHALRRFAGPRRGPRAGLRAAGAARRRSPKRLSLDAMTAFIVVDLGFGDAGKGTIVDYLCRRERATLVVRTNGGAQAGHNVVTADGRHHTFSQLGAGTFVPGVRTHLSRFVVVHPTALAIEAQRLEARGVLDPLARVTVAGDAYVTTPFHQRAC